MDPTISIVVCAHNEERLLRQCLGHLACQTYDSSRYQIVIVDDDSTDQTAAIAKDFVASRPAPHPRCTYLRIKRAGLSNARNAGILNSSTDLIAFIDGDAVAHPGWLTELSRAFLTNPGVGIVGGKVELLNRDSCFANLVYLSHSHTRTNTVQDVIGTNMAFRKEVFDEFGGFFSLFRSRGDETIFNHLATRSWKYVTAEHAIVHHEYPARVRQWLKTRYQNGYYGFLVRKGLSALGLRGVTPVRLLMSSSNKVLNLFFPIAAVLQLFVGNWWSFCFLVLTGLASACRYLGRGAIFKIFRSFVGVKRSTRVGWAIGVPFILLGNWIDDLGWTLGAMRFASQKEFSNQVGSAQVDERITT